MSVVQPINGTPGAENQFLLKDTPPRRMEVPRIYRPGQRRGRTTWSRVTGNTRRSRKRRPRRSWSGSDLDNSAFVRYLPGAVDKGLLTERHIDQSLRHVLTVRFRLGEFDPPELVPYTKIGKAEIDSPPPGTGASRGARIDRAAPRIGTTSFRWTRHRSRRSRSSGRLRTSRRQVPNYTGLYSTFVKPLGWHQEARGLQHQSAARTRQRHRRKRQPGSQLYRSRQRRQTGGCLRVCSSGLTRSSSAKASTGTSSTCRRCSRS